MKRILAGAVALFLAFAASATTYNPIGLLNPAGSTSGQAIVSTGPTTSPAWSNFPATALSAQAANTVVANATGASASPTAFAMPSCSTAASALTWTSATGFTCNTAINAGTLGGATFAAPGAIGSGTPGTGAFTTLNANGNDALLYQTSNALSVATSTSTTVTTWTKVYDRVNANFNASTGIFTAPATGYYQISAQLQWASSATSPGTAKQVSVVVNGTPVANGQTWETASTTSFNACSVSAVVLLTSGQTLNVNAFQTSGSTKTLSGVAASNYLSINRLP